MTRAMFDLMTDTSSDFVHTNVAGATIENLTADPSIEVELREGSDYTNNTNGRILFTNEDRGTSLERGEVRHKVYLITGRIEYQSITKKDDATIWSIQAEMERGYNVNNLSASRTYRRTFESAEYNNDAIYGVIDFILKVIEFDVSAIS